MLKIGCHVSIAKGIWNAPKNAADLGCETFQIFTRSPQGGSVPPITEEAAKMFRTEMEKYGFEDFVVHAPYIINFGSSNPRVYNGSIQIIRSDLERASQIGAKYVMFHPGSLKDDPEKGLKQVKEGFKKVLDGYKGTTKLLIENTAGAGHVVGATFEELAELMKPLLKHKGFGGICYDTQHGFGSGYDIRTEKAVEETFKQFDKIIGLEWLQTFQINDSKPELGSHKDRHEHIGDGHIGKKGFGALIKYLQTKGKGKNAHLNKLPLILETEHDKVVEDIKILKKLRG